MFAAIKVRGKVHLNPEIKSALVMLRLRNVNQLVLVNGTDSMKGMLKKTESYITYGEIDEKTLAMLLEKRARLQGNKRLDEKALKEKKIKSIEDLAKDLVEGKAKLKDFGIKEVFRLHPPKKGYERGGIKKPYSIGGALGYRADDINKLILRMI